MKKLGVIIGGILFVAIGIFLIIHGKAQAERCTEETVGTVIEIKEDTTIDDEGDISYTYYPVIEYKVGENTVSKQSSTGSGTSKYSVNDKVDILYNPNNIEEYIIKGDKSSNLFGIVFIVLGAVVFVLGIVRKF